jgi:hypothetical protein
MEFEDEVARLDSFAFAGIESANNGEDGDDDDSGHFFDTMEGENEFIEQLSLSDFGTTDETTDTSSDWSSSLNPLSPPPLHTSSLDEPHFLHLLKTLPQNSFQFTFQNLFEERKDHNCSSSSSTRYVIQDKMKPFLHIFPWFPLDKRVRYREIISAANSCEIVQKIIRAMNYWYGEGEGGGGLRFDERALELLRLYYQSPGESEVDDNSTVSYHPPEKDQWLSHIILVTERLQSLLSHSPPLDSHSTTSSSSAAVSSVCISSSTPSVESQSNTYDVPDGWRGGDGGEQQEVGAGINSSEARGGQQQHHRPISDRIDTHEEKLSLITEDLRELKVKSGGDRAGWLRIRPDDLPTRAQWCIEGGVFGLYADGVGPLVRCDVRRKRSVVVYSTDPDTVEAHPNPDDPDSYVRIVMVGLTLDSFLTHHLSLSLCLCLSLQVGEAPVKLCPRAYEKYKSLGANVELFVNYKGKVHCRSLRITDNSTHRIAFGTADAFTNHTPVDSEGYPCFQGTRGVRCRIHGIHDMRQYNNTDMMVATSDLSPAQRKKKKKESLLTKVGIGIGMIGVAAAVAVAVRLPSPHSVSLLKACLKDQDTNSSRFSDMTSDDDLSHELLLLRDEKKSIKSEIEELRQTRGPGWKQLIEQKEERLEKIKKKIRKIKKS